MLTREQALTKLQEMVENKNLIKHCLAVEAAMREYADYLGVTDADKESWEIAGLLHDADWERYPEKHPQVIVQCLDEIGVSPEIINAIEAHGFEFEVEPQTLMAKTLRAVDELTGLIVAVALVRESKKLEEVTVESIKKKWDQKGFAKGVKREDIEQGAKDIGVGLDEHVQIVPFTNPK
jgi:putative nucleotidyltransferase with HDIG domain